MGKYSKSFVIQAEYSLQVCVHELGAIWLGVRNLRLALSNLHFLDVVLPDMVDIMMYQHA